jgi:L-lactate dehydrogenase
MLDRIHALADGALVRVAAHECLQTRFVRPCRHRPAFTDEELAAQGVAEITRLPLGGVDLGYKGFALGIMIEALTSGLNGYGRAQRPTQWGASVFLQLIDPDAFAGRDAFTAETGHFADAARSSRVAPSAQPVRMPGERGLQRRADQMAHGVALHRGILPTLRPWADKLGVAVPRPLS